MLSYGEEAPDFDLPGVPERVKLSQLRQQGAVVVVFFSEASTPLCTRQLQPFVADYSSIQSLGGTVVAISRDDTDTLKRFAEEIEAPFPLASDSDLAVARAYGVAAEGDQAARRGVFVIDQSGTVRHANPDYVPSNPSEYEVAVMALSGP